MRRSFRGPAGTSVLVADDLRVHPLLAFRRGQRLAGHQELLGRRHRSPRPAARFTAAVEVLTWQRLGRNVILGRRGRILMQLVVQPRARDDRDGHALAVWQHRIPRAMLAAQRPLGQRHSGADQFALLKLLPFRIVRLDMRHEGDDRLLALLRSSERRKNQPRPFTLPR